MFSWACTMCKSIQLLPFCSPTWVIRCRIALCAKLLLPDCVRFSCCSPRDCIDPFQLLLSSQLALPVSFSCCSPLASASAAALDCSTASRLRPLRLLLLIASASTLLPDGIRFICCSPIASTSTAAPRLRPLWLLLLASCSGRVLEHSTQEFEVQ